MKKAEYEKKIGEYKDLLKEIYQALNQVRNTKVETKNFRDTYQICSKLNKVINE